MIVLLLLLVQLPPQAPPLEIPPQAPPVREVIALRTYADAFHAAQHGNRPLVIFAGCKAPVSLAPSTYVIYEASAEEWRALSGKAERGIIVAVNGYRHKTLEAGATIGQIEGEVLRATAPVQPRAVRSIPGGRVETLQRIPFQTRSC